jgi:hypothetical protein
MDADAGLGISVLGFVEVCVVCCGVIFSDKWFLCCKCLRAHGGCLGTGSR